MALKFKFFPRYVRYLEGDLQLFSYDLVKTQKGNKNIPNANVRKRAPEGDLEGCFDSKRLRVTEGVLTVIVVVMQCIQYSVLK